MLAPRFVDRGRFGVAGKFSMNFWAGDSKNDSFSFVTRAGGASGALALSAINTTRASAAKRERGERIINPFFGFEFATGTRQTRNQSCSDQS